MSEQRCGGNGQIIESVGSGETGGTNVYRCPGCIDCSAEARADKYVDDLADELGLPKPKRKGE